MRQMQPTEIKPFLERFDYCADGTINSFFLHKVGLGDKGGHITLYIDCGDYQKEFGDWCSLIIELRGVLYFQIKGIFNVANWIFSSGIFILNENDKWGLDIGDDRDDPKSMNELEQSPSYIVAKEIWWDVKPSQET